MLNHPTLDKLVALTLTGMAKARSEQMDVPESQTLSFDERLGLLVDREMTVSSARRLTTRLRQAKLRLSASVEDIDYRHPRGLETSRGVKRITRPMLGFKSFEAAQDTLVGIELMHMIKKKQLMVEPGDEGLTAAEQFYALAA